MLITRRPIRGTVIAYFLVLVSVLTTGLLTTIALTSGSESQVANVTLKRDACFYAAEAGIQRAYWLLEYSSSWFPGGGGTATTTGTLGSATYRVTAQGAWNSPVLITSVGTIGGGVTSVTVFATASPPPADIVPAIALGNNFNNSGNVTITGDIMAAGFISTSGRFTETGSLYAGSTISTNGSVDISGTTNPNHTIPPPPPIDTAGLIGGKYGSVLVINVPNGSKNYNVSSLDFTSGGGNYSVIYFKGGAINFKGSVNITYGSSGAGTIVTDSDMSVQSAASLGSSNQPGNLNLVVGIGSTGGSLDISGYLGLDGSVYVNNGSITKHGGLNITGVLEANGAVNSSNGSLSTNGGFSLTRAQPPAFDPRSNGSVGTGQGSFTLTGETGPIF